MTTSEAIENALNKLANYEDLCDINHLRELVDADVAEVRTGRWIDNQHWEYANGNMTMSGDTGAKCSVCQVVNFTGIGNQHTAYCPNCGAKMGKGGSA